MARTIEAKPRNDAYTGLLAVSFLALLLGCVLMFMDAESLGKPPGKLDIPVPGTSLGKPGEGLQRPDVGKGAPPPPKEGGMGRAEPRELPPLPELAAAPTATPVVPVKAEAPANPDAPPLPVPSFVPPQ
jgi:hypothetical protein